MKFPIDDTTLNAWATLLGLTEQQARDVLQSIEHSLRTGYVSRPIPLRHLSFEELTADMDVSELALLFLVQGLIKADYPKAAREVEMRGLFARLLGHHFAD